MNSTILSNTSRSVIKAGGGPMSDCISIKNFVNLANSDPRFQIFVLSAPGRTEDSDKITDLLISCYNNATSRLDFQPYFDQIASRFTEISACFGLESLDIYLARELWTKLYNLRKYPNSVSYDWVVSRGEYMISKIVAEILGATLVKPEECIFLGHDNRILNRTYPVLADLLSDKTRRYVVPGFYGCNNDGELAIFPRGWSDTSGAIVAKAINAFEYVNLKDVPGVAIADPKIVGDDVEYLTSLTPEQMYELSSRGAGVLHPSAIAPVEEAEIPIRFVSVYEPQIAGTVVTKDSVNDKLALTGCKQCVSYHIYRPGMDDQIGFGEAALRILHRGNVSFEHITTGQQDMTITLLQSEVDKIGEDALCSDLATKLKAKVDYFPISTVSIVSIGRAIGPALIGKIANALSEIDIDFQFISKASGRSLTMGINRSEYDVVIRTLYDICVT